MRDSIGRVDVGHAGLRREEGPPAASR